MNNQEQIEKIEKKIKKLQNEVDKLKVEVVEDKNAFVKEGNAISIDEFSREWFADSFAFQILHGSTPLDRPALKGRAFYVSPDYKVELIETYTGTAIAIFKK